ncbi:MAG: RES family NAD+ phosphorylase [Bacteroidota bacterium]
MIVYRLTKEKYKSDISGKGAELYGARWNSKGTAILYTASNIALCMAETAVHVPFGILPKNYFLLKIFVPTDVAIKNIEKLPEDWNYNPPKIATKIIGDNFVRDNEYLLLKVPSAVVQGEFNYLINVRHPDYKLVNIQDTVPFQFDKRRFIK